MQLGKGDKGGDICGDLFIAEKEFKKRSYRTELAHNAQRMIADDRFRVLIAALLDILGQIILKIPKLTGCDFTDLFHGNQPRIAAGKIRLLHRQVLKKEPQIISIGQPRQSACGLRYGVKKSVQASGSSLQISRMR